MFLHSSFPNYTAAIFHYLASSELIHGWMYFLNRDFALERATL